jgi:hypothetical protein
MAVLFAEEVDLKNVRALRFQAPEFEHWMYIYAEVAWISDSRKQAGIRFKGLSESARTQLRAGISIATTRARRAAQAKLADGPTESRQYVKDAQEGTDAMQPSSAAPPVIDTPAPATTESAARATLGSTSSITADSATPVASEAQSISNEVQANSLVQGKTIGDEVPSHSPVREAPQDSPLPEARPAIEPGEKTILLAESRAPLVEYEYKNILNEVDANSLVQEKTSGDERPSHSPVREAPQDSPLLQARPELQAKEKTILSAEPKKDTRTQRPNLADTKPQKTSSALALDARSSALPLQKSAVAHMPSRNLFPSNVVRQPSNASEGISSRANTSRGKWMAVSAIAILASLLAFLVGWILGDPSRVRLGH